MKNDFENEKFAIFLAFMVILVRHMKNTILGQIKVVQCNLDLVDNLWFSDYFLRLFFNLLQKIIWFSDIMRFSEKFCGDQ